MKHRREPIDQTFYKDMFSLQPNHNCAAYMRQEMQPSQLINDMIQMTYTYK